MRRSGANGRMQVLERVILPRIFDVARSMQELAKINHDNIYLEFCIDDFSDNFLTMFLHPSEGCNEVVKDNMGKYLSILVCSFGLAAAPLLWGRLANMIMRLSQAGILDWEGRAQCFVADPILIAAGQNRRDRTVVFLRFLLCVGVCWASR